MENNDQLKQKPIVSDSDGCSVKREMTPFEKSLQQAIDQKERDKWSKKSDLKLASQIIMNNAEAVNFKEREYLSSLLIRLFMEVSAQQ